MSTAAILFDALIAKFGLRNDADLACSLEVDPCNISRLRAGRRQMGPELVLRIHDVFRLAVAVIKTALGMRALPLAECLAAPRAG